MTRCNAQIYISARLGGGFTSCRKPAGHAGGHSSLDLCYASMPYGKSCYREPDHEGEHSDKWKP